MDPPRPAPALAAVDSVESSPRSRTTDSFDDSLPPVPGAPPKLRLMCSYGGHVVPRPHDKSLCYVGGDTRMVVVDRNATLAGLTARVATTLFLQTKQFVLKYQLPNEDLDSLISLAGDEDLENMIEEYNRICAAAGAGGKGSRLRLFVFPAKSESVASIGSLLDSSVKSDEWFLSALNGSSVLIGGFSDSASVNCLLGLENDSVGANKISNNELRVSRGLNSQFGNEGKNVKISNQDVHSVPDSPMMETTSSFGSANSPPSLANLPPSLANLPPIKVREDDGGMKAQDQRLGMEEQFVQTSVSAPGESFMATSSHPLIPTTTITSMPIPSTVMTSLAPIAGDFQNRVVSDEERSDTGSMLGHGRKSPQPQSQVLLQQRPGGGTDSPKPDAFPSDGSVLNATPRSNQMGYQEVIQVNSGENRISANLVDQRSNVIDPNNVPVYQLQKPTQGSGYMVQPQVEPQHSPYPQQFVHAGIHYVVQQPGNPIVMPAHYPLYPPLQQVQRPHHQPIQLQPQPYQHPVYIVQAPPPPQGYSMSIQQHTYPENTAVAHTSHVQTPLNLNRIVADSATAFSNNPNVSRAPPNPEVSSAIYRTTSAVAQPMVQVAANIPPQQFINYSQVNQQPQPQVTSAPNPTYSYDIQDAARAQIYYTQPLGPSLISQYQTISSAQAMEAASVQTQPQNDSMKPAQIKSS